MFSDADGYACYPWTECSWDFPEVAPPSSASDRVCSGPQPFRQFGTEVSDSASQVAVDDDGNVYIAGATLGPLDGPTYGDADAFVRKYSPRGELIWAFQGDPGHTDTPVGLALDDVGHLHVLVDQDGQTALWMFDLEGTRLSEQIQDKYYNALAVDSQGARYIARPTLTRLNADGSSTWTVTETGGPSDWPSALTVAPNGDVIVCGSTDGSMFGPGSGRKEAVFARYDVYSNPVWSIQFGSIDLIVPVSMVAATDVALDSAENVYVVGYVVLDEYGSTDGFISHVDPYGQLGETNFVGSSDYDTFNAIAIDAFDQIAIIGTTWGMLDPSSTYGEEVFIARFNGGLGPVMQFGTTAVDGAYDLASAPDGAWFVVGATAGSFPGWSNAGDNDAYVLRVPPF
jgi:WD40 repeat protein